MSTLIELTGITKILKGQEEPRTILRVQVMATLDYAALAA